MTTRYWLAAPQKRERGGEGSWEGLQLFNLDKQGYRNEGTANNAIEEEEKRGEKEKGRNKKKPNGRFFRSRTETFEKTGATITGPIIEYGKRNSTTARTSSAGV